MMSLATCEKNNISIEYTYSTTERLPMVSEQEINRIHELPKVIEDDWVWEVNGPNLTGEATVYCLDDGVNLTLKAWKRRNYGFCLLYKRSKIVRRWDDGNHTNPDGERIEGSHKHYWTPEYEDTFAYEVDDIATDDVDQAFWDFLDEENIELNGSYTSQKELTDV